MSDIFAVYSVNDFSMTGFYQPALGGLFIPHKGFLPITINGGLYNVDILELGKEIAVESVDILLEKFDERV